MTQTVTFSMTNSPLFLGSFSGPENDGTATDIEFQGRSSNGSFMVFPVDCDTVVQAFDQGSCTVDITFDAPSVPAGIGLVDVSETFNVTYRTDGDTLQSSPILSFPITLSAGVEAEEEVIVFAEVSAIATPDPLDFGEVPVGTQDVRELAIQVTNVADNSTGHAQDATGFLVGLQEPQEFTILSETCSNIDRLSPGQSDQCVVMVGALSLIHI